MNSSRRSRTCGVHPLPDPALLERWSTLSALRERVLAEIEPLRKNKQIGSSLQAKVVLSATPAERARRLCPQAVFVPPDFEHYRARSRDVFAVLRDHVEQVEGASLDEAPH